MAGSAKAYEEKRQSRRARKATIKKSLNRSQQGPELLHTSYLSYLSLISQARNDRDYSPLALASDYGRSPVVRLLIVSRADTEARDHRGHTPLMHASREVNNDKE